MSKYVKNYITSAIIKVDFVPGDITIEDKLPNVIKTECLKHFPIQELKLLEFDKYKIKTSKEDVSADKTRIKTYEWNFWGSNREKHLVLTSNFLYIDYKKYVDFDSFMKSFMDVLRKIVKQYPNIHMNRIGLRYVDTINLSDDSSTPKDWNTFWKKYINNNLINSLTFIDDNNALSRHMNSIEMNYDRYKLRYQYGIYNSDYPAPNKKKEFILDSDLYSICSLNLEDIESLVSEFHDISKSWFEKSITKNLRSKMEGN